ncbi:MAG: HAMP domain-containing protein [Gammaproteobacteria bacterium]|nr:MAG: HAMP domain-containing protein [Gammaproteobacteria bacterium]
MLQSIRFRIILTALPPLVLAIFYIGMNLAQGQARLDALNRLAPAINVASSVSALVHEMQKERGASAGYLASGSDKFRALVDKQRAATTTKLESLTSAIEALDENALAEDVRAALKDYQDALKTLPGLRHQVDQRSLSVQEELRLYTALNSKGLRIVEEAGHEIAHPVLRSHFDAYTAFLQSKERAGIERAVLSATFGGGAFKDGLARHFLRLVAEQDAFMSLFEAKGPEEVVKQYQGLKGQGAFAEVEDYRRAVYQAIDALTEGQSFSGFTQDAPTWFQTITRKIGQLKKLEDEQNAMLGAMVESLQSTTEHEVWRDSLIMLIAIALVSGAVLWLVANLMRPIQRAVQAAERIGQGDLTARLDSQREDELGVLLRALQAMQNALRDILQDESTQTQEVVAMAEKVRANAETAYSGAEKQKSEADQLATAMNEMTASFHDVAQSTEQTAEAAEHGREQSENGMRELDNLIQAMSRLNDAIDHSANTITRLEEKTQTIATTLNTISGIAEQTNLLALNAAIEAARAGDQGRGFAVVADEVRQLAGRTQEATVEITNVIQSLTEEVNEAVAQMNHARERSADADEHSEATRRAIEAINQAIADITDRMQQVASASTQQSAVAEEINQNVLHIAEQAELNAETAAQNREAGEALERVAEALAGHVRRFRLD